MTPAASPKLDHPFERARSRLRGGLSLRARILLLFVAVNVLCAMAAGIVSILNARRATEVEIASSLDVAKRLVRETATRLQRDVGRVTTVEEIAAALPSVRHMRVVALDTAGRPVGAGDAVEAEDEESEHVAPAWFAAMIEPAPSHVEIPIVIAGAPAGTIAVRGEASDEIAEVWDDLVALAGLFFVLNVAAVAAFATVLGRILAPLGALADGMTDLRLGRHGRALTIPKTRELAAIVERYNALNQTLAGERATNVRMSWRMVTLQDDERRQIAKELHDELGPCLFGLRANVASLERAAGVASGGQRLEIADRLATVAELSERLADMNRGLLRRLRPMALGAAPLADVLAGLVADFQRQHPERRFELETRGLAEAYGEAVDLTIYRCVQEGVTNAIRHAACSLVAVTVEPGVDETGRDAVRIRVLDDGGGVSEPAPAGFGLMGLGERLRALGGSLHLHNVRSGAALDVVVPLAQGSDFAVRKRFA